VELMEKQPGITSIHGRVKRMDFHGLSIKLIPLFHPAAIIYKRDLIPLWEKDMEIVKKEVHESKVQKKLF
jgi:uracil-DNA glycosylase